ncbi:MAG: NUDIX hydrolase [Candidatus Pacebacteria bacterium]|nr:NUDIX hydrolase [Candidatus Paceibacterota bacterium]
MNAKQHRPRHLNRRTLAAGDWLTLEEIEYVDHAGRKRTWETSARQGRGGAVFMITKLQPSERYVLVRQYRPPMDAYVLEFPAGLVDPGEDPEQTAVRELLEETGYTGTITWLGPQALTSPGMTREGVTLAIMVVDEQAEENLHPEQTCEESEDIEVILKTAVELPAYLRKCWDSGVHLDSRLVAFFLGEGIRW